MNTVFPFLHFFFRRSRFCRRSHGADADADDVGGSQLVSYDNEILSMLSALLRNAPGSSNAINSDDAAINEAFLVKCRFERMSVVGFVIRPGPRQT